MCSVHATYNNTQNIQTKIFIVIHRGWSKSLCRSHFFNRIHKNLNFQTFMNVHIYINNPQSVILSSLKISWPILHHRLSPLSTLQSAKRNPFEPLWWTSLYFSSDFLFLSASQRICALFVSPYARIRGCRKNRGLIEAKERGRAISGREMQIENLRPPYARVHRQENWGCARIIRIARGRDAIVQRALSHHRHGGIIFFPPYPVEICWLYLVELAAITFQFSPATQKYPDLFASFW